MKTKLIKIKGERGGVNCILATMRNRTHDSPFLFDYKTNTNTGKYFMCGIAILPIRADNVANLLLG